MALSKTVLGPLLKNAIQGLSDEDSRDPDKLFEAMAGAIIDHIHAAASITGVCVGLVAPPGVAGGPVTGTAVLPPGSIL